MMPAETPCFEDGGWSRRSAACLVVLASLCTGLHAQSALPDAPAPNPALLALAAPAPLPLPQTTPFPPQAPRNYRHQPGIPSLSPEYVPLPVPCHANSCSEIGHPAFCCETNPDLFQVYLRQTATEVYTPRALGSLAFRSVIDPFNLLTIVGTSAYSVATDPHSPYGPGMMGWARFSGVSLTQDMTGEFFGTFLIPSIDHQDPHYHRMPNAPLIRRIWHATYQPFWIDTDRGASIPNYSTLAGGIAEEAINDAYVPYRQVGWSASAQRIAVSWATAPIGNFVTEFVPDVARHINLNIVFVQRIINQVATEEGGGATGSLPPP